MKIGVVSDIHYGPDADTQLGTHAPELLETFLEAMRAFRPDLIVELGDRINPISHDDDLKRTAWVHAQLARAGVPVYHVLGNTDVVYLAKPELLSALEQRASNEQVDQWTPRVVVLDSVDPPFERVGGEVGERQLTWLAGALEHDPRPSLLFCHHPLDDQDLSGHRYFAGHPDRACVVNRRRVRALFDRGGPVLGVFAGHLHWSRTTVIDRVPHITVGSLVDSAYTDGRPSGAFAEVTVAGRHLEIRIAGRQPALWRLALTV